MKTPLLFRRLAFLLPLLLMSMMAQATHFRYGSLTYQTGGVSNRVVQFKLSVAYRENFFGTPPTVGQVVTGVGYLDFGDGTDQLFDVTVTAVGPNYFYGEVNTTHTYATSGNFTAVYTGGDRISTLKNNPDALWYISTLVVAGNANDSPVSSLPPIVNLPNGQAAASYIVPAGDPNGNALTYSVATAADLGGIAFTNAPGLAVNATTGVVTFNTVGKAVGDFYNAVIKISDGTTSILVDHLIQIAPAGTVTARPPVFVYPPTPTNGQLYSVTAGQQVAFTVQASDPDAGDVVSLQALGLPAGSTMSPSLPVSGNPVQSAFSWTPTAASIGTTVINFVAQDLLGAQSNTSVTIQVASACNPTANTPVANPDQLSALCGPLVITPAQLLANDTNPQAGALQIASVGQPSSGTLVLNPDNTYTYTPASNFSGTATFTYTVQLAGPVLASPSNGHYYEFVSAPGICWTAAQTAAAARTYNGLSGYLATITTAAETNFVKGRMTGNYWFGAADNVTEGSWMWKSGPEAGTTFYAAGATLPGQYSNWSLNEPNDFKNIYRPVGEDYAHFYGESGLWNDLDECGTSGGIGGYLVEYGGLEACTPVLYATGTVTINVAPAPPTLKANNDQFAATSGQPLTITTAQLTSNDTDPQNRSLVIASTGMPTDGSLVNNNGTYTYTPNSYFSGTATFTYVLQLAGPVLASPATGHYYEFVAAPGICWTAAQAAASARTYNGMTGYLATVTSAAETDFLKGRSSNSYWFGAADNLTEGEWRWKSGPEAGQQFWQGAANGTALRYSNWSPGEPDDFKNQFRPAGEDYGQFYGASGFWNDLSDCDQVAGYIVEYGGLEACTPVLYSTGTVSVNVTKPAGASRAANTTTLESFPNPSNGQFRVQVVAGADGPAQMDLIDLSGRRVGNLFNGELKAGEKRDVLVNVPELPTGIYTIRLQGSQGVKHLRVSIQK
jgi:hypothetical protein